MVDNILQGFVVLIAFRTQRGVRISPHITDALYMFLKIRSKTRCRTIMAWTIVKSANQGN